MQFPRWSANRSSPTGPAMCTHQAFLASDVHTPSFDVHTPSFSCQRCAHTKLFFPAMCTEPGQQQQSPREATRCSSLDGRQIDHRRAGPAWCNPHGRRLDAVPLMVGKSIIAEPGHVSKHWMKVYRPGRLKESLSRVATVPIGGDRSKRRRGTRRFSAFCPSSVRVNPDNSRS